MADKNYVARITLGKPIKFADETISELKFVEPTARHFYKVQGDSENTFAVILDVAAACAGFPPSALVEMSGPDVMKVVNKFGPFVMDGQETGKTS